MLMCTRKKILDTKMTTLVKKKQEWQIKKIKKYVTSIITLKFQHLFLIFADEQ